MSATLVRPRDGWVSWEVPAVDGAPSWCCFSDGAVGARGGVSYSVGFAARLNDLIASMLDSKGTIASRISGINTTVKDIGKQRDSLSLRLSDVQDRYLRQFTSLDTLIGSLKQTSSFLTQQIARLK